MGQVLSVSSRALVDACRKRGVDVEALIKSAGLTKEKIYNPDARISVHQMAELWRQAYALSGDDHLALHAAESLEAGAYRIIDFLAGHSATVGEALSKISDYSPLINTSVYLPIDYDNKHVNFRLETNDGSSISRAYAEYFFAACYLRVAQVVGDFKPEMIEFSHPAPKEISEHQRIFRCPVYFEKEGLRMVISKNVWQQKSVNSNPVLFSVLDQHAQMLVGELQEPLSILNQVRKAIIGELRGGNPNLEWVSKKIGVSTRTLQRRLHEQSTSFGNILEEMRESMAKNYLEDKRVSIVEVAFLLGFSEQSSFQRAFKRWTGLTPLQYRQTLKES